MIARLVHGVAVAITAAALGVVVLVAATWRIVLAVLIVIWVASCTAAGSGKELRLTGDAASALRKLIKHDAITLTERTAIYGVPAPEGSRVVCHEREHQRQIAVVADALVALGAIDDDELSRAAVWLALYLQDSAIYGYDNRWEKGARAACP